ncbi:MAG: ABC transporter permease [Nocardioides sp.]|uniref:ABC transporter permease n=1 Tax=Nocardioides sp. TaxID=35761 RepID=UPI0039E4BEE9
MAGTEPSTEPSTGPDTGPNIGPNIGPDLSAEPFGGAGSADGSTDKADKAEREAQREARRLERRAQRLAEKQAQEKAEREQERASRAVRVVDAPLASPAAHLGLLTVFRRGYLLRLLVRREISGRYANSFMGLFWSYINPLSQFFIYWFVMGEIIGAHKNVENYPVHVFSGMIVVHFFTETFGAGTRSIVQNKSIVRKMAMPREMFPVAAMLVSFYHVLPAGGILVIAAAATGWTPDPAMLLAVLLSLGIIMTLGTALALLFSVANVFFRDFGSAVSILTHFVRFGVPMIYTYEMVASKFGTFAHYYMLNPIASAVLLMQRAFWVGTTSDPAETLRVGMPHHLWLDGLGALGASLVLLVIAQLVFNKFENRIPERL